MLWGPCSSLRAAAPLKAPEFVDQRWLLVAVVGVEPQGLCVVVSSR